MLLPKYTCYAFEDKKNWGSEQTKQEPQILILVPVGNMHVTNKHLITPTP